MANNDKQRSDIREQMLVIGAGYVGTAIAKHCKERYAVSLIDKDEVDISSMTSVNRTIAHYQPDIVVNAAAIADTHFAEKPENRDLTFKVNVQGPLNLEYAAYEYNFRLVHLSTGMIFTGTPGDVETESSQPTPISYYAWTKAWADAALLQNDNGRRVLITRIQLPISSEKHPRNLLAKLPQFESYLEVPRSFTVLEDYNRALVQLLDTDAYGLYNVACDGAISFLEIAQMLQQHGLIEADKHLRSISYEDLAQATHKKGGAVPTDTVLDVSKLKKTGFEVRSVKQAIAEAITQLSSGENHEN